MSDLMVSSSLLVNAEKGLMMAKTVVENLDKKLLKQNERIQELEKLLKEAKAIICCCDSSFFTGNLDFIKRVEETLRGVASD